MNTVFDLQPLTTHWIYQLVKEKNTLVIGENAMKKTSFCFDYLSNKLKNNSAPIYGINTGFGSLCNTVISNDQLHQLQENLVKSHACGTGDKIPEHIVRNMMVLKVINMSLGHSGVSPATVSLLTAMYNNGITPVVYAQGSLGASGDLAPLAHLTLPVLGLGEVYFKGEIVATKKAFDACGLHPIKLHAKEGLALLNGTQFMCAFGVELVEQAQAIFKLANLIASVSLDAYDCRMDPFHPDIHKIRAHEGQIETARQIRENLDNSEIAQATKQYVQDPYSFRCIPQVHGASFDAIQYAQKVFNTEINSVSDNPTIFPEQDLIISAGNFHGQPLAVALDLLAIAIAEMGSIAERRVYKLISGTRDLPPFLVKNAGINSGFMIPQYTAASIASQNKQYCTPAVIDSIDSSNGQEDHVSMGANSATKCYKVLENTKRILAIELMNASQAIAFRNGKKSSTKVETLLTSFRKEVPFVEEDVQMNLYIAKAVAFVEKSIK